MWCYTPWSWRSWKLDQKWSCRRPEVSSNLHWESLLSSRTIVKIGLSFLIKTTKGCKPSLRASSIFDQRRRQPLLWTAKGADMTVARPQEDDSNAHSLPFVYTSLLVNIHPLHNSPSCPSSWSEKGVVLAPIIKLGKNSDVQVGTMEDRGRGIFWCPSDEGHRTRVSPNQKRGSFSWHADKDAIQYHEMLESADVVRKLTTIQPPCAFPLLDPMGETGMSLMARYIECAQSLMVEEGPKSRGEANRIAFMIMARLDADGGL